MLWGETVKRHAFPVKVFASSVAGAIESDLGCGQMTAEGEGRDYTAPGLKLVFALVHSLPSFDFP